MTKIEEFEELRALLFSIAYRILGSVSEAEDAVQDTWLRYAAAATQPASVKAYLSAVVTRVSIDVLRSARVRREQYVGPWFPEPLLTDPYQDPERSAELADSVSMAALLLDEGRPRFEADHREREELAERFFEAFRVGDVDGLRELLAADVFLLGDAGGNVPQWRRIDGAANVARLLAALFAPFARIGCVVEPREVNGQSAAIVRDREDKVLGIWVLDILDGRVQAIRALLNPEKLGHIGPTADARAVIREAYQTRR